MARYLIVGGVAGGATTAARIRRLDEKAEILLFERGEHISFANCGLPYYIGGVIKERDRLFVTTVDSFHKRYRIDIRPFNEVISIDRSAKKVRVREVKTGREYEESYDKLLLSPGAEPLRPPIPGIDSEGIFTLRNVPDTDTIKSWIDTKNPSHAVVIGGGFIGVEMAENLAHKGIAVTLVEALDQVMTVLDFEMAAEVHNHIRSKKVQLILKDGVKSFEKKGAKLVVELSSGRTIETEMVILSIGVRPESSLAKKAGLELTERGAIIVDAHLRTSDKNIYAVGDAIAFDYPLVKKKLSIYLAGPANKQGRIAADNIVLGDTRIYKGTIGTSVAKVFDMTVASTGLSEKVLKAEGVTCLSSVTHSSSHAGYYPEAKPMSIKLVFSPEGKVYGAQITGYDGVDTRIDMIAAVLGMGGTVFDLEELEHAYAPPFSSAKDPVNTAGFAAENVVRGLVKNVSWNEIADEKDSFQLDVRTRNEFSLGAIPGSVNIPIDELRENLHQIPKGRRIVTNCAAGLRGYLAARILQQNGYNDVVNLSGGYKTWERATAPQDSAAAEEYIGSDDMVYKKGVAPEALQSPDAIILDACGLACPGPIVKLKAAVDTMLEGRELVVTATDPGFARDVRSWCAMTGNTLLMVKEEVGKVIAVIRKGTLHKEGVQMVETSAGQTIIVFSDDLDKALAAFVLATGGSAAGKKVTMFFTFWGLSVIKKPKARGVKKDLMGRMFGMMLPSNAGKLGLSKINMCGIGAGMMRMRMKSKKIDSLETMMNTARAAGVEMMACQMSMDVMGVAREEFYDFVTVGGVAAYLEAASKSGINLFI